MIKNLKWCSNCLAMSTRPRITFDKSNFCNACVWSKKKKKYDWNHNLKKLKNFVKKILKKKIIIIALYLLVEVKMDHLFLIE